MRCKAGDLAVVVEGQLSAGRVVRCLRLIRPGEVHPSRNGRMMQVPGVLNGPAWLIEGWVFLEGIDGKNYECCIAPDRALRPIRDPGDDARDETLDWLPVPAKETANA